MGEKPPHPAEPSEGKSRHDTILTALVFFALAALLANGWLVWSAVGKRRDLVREDYYEAGLREDERRVRMAAAAAYRIDADWKEGHWVVKLSPLGQTPSAPDFEGNTLCRAYFQKPDDARQDFFLELHADAVEPPAAKSAYPDLSGSPHPVRSWSGKAPDMKAGLWNVRIEWSRPDGDSLVAFMESTRPWTAHASR